ncbi:hypothetical protein CYMTET_52893 [Cymbomonas tetramitiformis]|uniref:Uncharacterized protein n=1 Tax=Cymbomonas tetramitiformis TaxID=36881 RepID=A0AAE0EQW2_9CHLO|nr:hypothetical protein CYMTET_52893 [Cymbomonas tetramitiformis]
MQTPGINLQATHEYSQREAAHDFRVNLGKFGDERLTMLSAKGFEEEAGAADEQKNDLANNELSSIHSGLQPISYKQENVITLSKPIKAMDTAN